MADLRRPSDVPGPSALLLQAAVDVVVVTSLISFTPATATSVAALYVALVTVYALLLPVGRGLLAVALAVACYVRRRAFTRRGAAGRPASGPRSA